MEIKNIRIQGIREIEIGGRGGFNLNWNLYDDYPESFDRRYAHAQTSLPHANAQMEEAKGDDKMIDEFVEEGFPDKFKTRSYKIPDINKKELRSYEAAHDPLPNQTFENLRSAVTEFEVWCNDGYDWLVQSKNSDKWVSSGECISAG
jgi:hypothetical protein